MTSILLIGHGAREHALAKKIVESAEQPDLYAFMKANNPGIAQLATQTQLGNYTDEDAIKSFAQQTALDFAVIGPEDPLALGVVDLLESIGIPSVGPKKILAQLESSKGFTRMMMKKHSINGCPQCQTFDSEQGIKEFLDSLDEVVVKPDGLTGGKGVRVQGDHFQTKEEAHQYCLEILQKGSVVIEEKLNGEEFSLQSFTDGKTVVDCPVAQDHKRAYEEDKGPNTGGMGSYTDANQLLPFLKQEHLDQAHAITQQMADALYKEFGEYYKGVMYGGFIITNDGVKLIEYNARMGDPEAMNVLSLLSSDFVELCRAIIGGHLEEYELSFDPKATVCKYVVPKGYPDNPVKNSKIEIDLDASEALTYYASVDQKEDGLYMSGSRAIAFVGVADTIADAEKIAEQAIASVKGEVFHRPDIGTAPLIQKRIDHMNNL